MKYIVKKPLHLLNWKKPEYGETDINLLTY
jgi:hypothetical protein